MKQSFVKQWLCFLYKVYYNGNLTETSFYIWKFYAFHVYDCAVTAKHRHLLWIGFDPNA